MDFEDKLQKSKYIHQFKCKCGQMWWGPNTNNECRRCKIRVERLPFEKMYGIGYFLCACRRNYAGFSFGNITSKCHGCQTENKPLFILPGDKADKDDNKNKKQHYCSMCHGTNNCPVVERIKTKNFRRF